LLKFGCGENGSVKYHHPIAQLLEHMSTCKGLVAKNAHIWKYRNPEHFWARIVPGGLGVSGHFQARGYRSHTRSSRSHVGYRSRLTLGLPLGPSIPLAQNKQRLPLSDSFPTYGGSYLALTIPFVGPQSPCVLTIPRNRTSSPCLLTIVRKHTTVPLNRAS
jgi:hypothetical protein